MSKRSSSSSSSSTKKYTRCVVCSSSIPSKFYNSHVNDCLERSERRANANPAPVTVQTTSTTSTAVKESSTSPLSEPDVHDRTFAANVPLAERMRPHTIEQFVRVDASSNDSSLEALLRSEFLPSIIFQGPPGCGKTTLARLLATRSQRKQFHLSAAQHGTKDVQKVIEQAQQRLQLLPRQHRHSSDQRSGCSTCRPYMSVVVVDEIHRWNKLQQDLLLPPLEQGLLLLFGCTTESPAFTLNRALISRCSVVVLPAHTPNTVARLLRRAVDEHLRCGMRVDVSDKSLDLMAASSGGDARRALGLLEAAAWQCREDSNVDATVLVSDDAVRQSVVSDSTSAVSSAYSTTIKFDLMSALHKSIRGSDCDATVYYLSRLLSNATGGGSSTNVDIYLYVARRLVRCASEDIGIADSSALPLAVAAMEAVKLIGAPECDVVLAHCATYLARAPKSIACYEALKKAHAAVASDPTAPVPFHLRNGGDYVLKHIEKHGDGYVYPPHASASDAAAQRYLPERVQERFFTS